MTQRKISDILRGAQARLGANANEFQLRSTDPNKKKDKFICHAVTFELGLEWDKRVDQSLPVVQFLKELGMPTHAHAFNLDFGTWEQEQGARFQFLDMAILVAEEEGL